VGICQLSEKVLITGGAGFIGSNLADWLINQGKTVAIFDNFSTGKNEFVSKGIQTFRGSLTSDPEILEKALSEVSTVYHLAANADVRDGWLHPRLDLQQNVEATCNILEASVRAGVSEFVFSSTGSVYGESETLPTPEDAPFPVQTSLYGASKASAEAFVQAYATAGKLKATVFRFVSVLGARYTHGHVIDFVRQLEKNPNQLIVLGDGTQKKSYMLVDDCVRAVASLRGQENFTTFNLGVNDYCSVKQSIGWITDELGIQPEVIYGEGNKGWVGDNPFIWLDVSKADLHGWKATSSIEDSVRATVRWLKQNPKILSDK
jgi:UDP-glucose 4-epimerase